MILAVVGFDVVFCVLILEAYWILPVPTVLLIPIVGARHSGCAPPILKEEGLRDLSLPEHLHISFYSQLIFSPTATGLESFDVAKADQAIQKLIAGGAVVIRTGSRQGWPTRRRHSWGSCWVVFGETLKACRGSY